MDEEDRVVELSDLVERLYHAGGDRRRRDSRHHHRRRRRFRRIFVDGDEPHDWEDFPLREDEYTEWRLRASPEDMLDLLDTTPNAADVLLHNLLFACPGGRNTKVVWFSHRNAIVCEGGPGDDDNLLPDRIFPEHRLHVSTTTNDDDDSSGGGRYRLTVNALESLDPDEEEEEDMVLHLLHKVVALATGIRRVKMTFAYEGYHPGIVPGIQDFVSLPRSRRTVVIFDGVTRETGRILAYHCSPAVELEVELDNWQDHGAVMAEAMIANQCPRRLSMGCCLYLPNVIARGIAANTSMEELTMELPFREESIVLWDAVARNNGIRTLIARPVHRVKYRYLDVFWRTALTSNSICRIDASKVVRRESIFDPCFDKERRECTETIATLIRSNPRITTLQYHPMARDVEIMETRVMPIVYLNRFRPVVQSAFDGRPARAAVGAPVRDQAREFSALIGSPLVRRHPELLFCLLKAGRDYLLLAPPPISVGGGRRASARLARKRRGRF